MPTKKTSRARAKTTSATQVATKASVGQKVTVTVGLLLAFGAIAAGFATLPGRSWIKVVDSSPQEPQKEYHFAQKTVELIDFQMTAKASGPVGVDELSLIIRPRNKALIADAASLFTNFQLWSDFGFYDSDFKPKTIPAIASGIATSEGVKVTFQELDMFLATSTLTQFTITADVMPKEYVNPALEGSPIAFMVHSKDVEANVTKVIGKSFSYPTFITEKEPEIVLPNPVINYNNSSPSGASSYGDDHVVAIFDATLPPTADAKPISFDSFTINVNSAMWKTDPASPDLPATIEAKLYEDNIFSSNLLQAKEVPLADVYNVVSSTITFTFDPVEIDSGMTEDLFVTLDTYALSPKANDVLCVNAHPDNNWSYPGSVKEFPFKVSPQVKCLSF